MRPELYLDENLPLRLESVCQARGYAVTSTWAERRFGSPDPHQLLYAAERGRILITHNRKDFRLLHDAWHLWSYAWGSKQQHSGILVIDAMPNPKSEDLANIIDAILGDSDTAMVNSLYDWRPATGWRRFPN